MSATAKSRRDRAAAIAVLFAISSPALAQSFSSGSTGADGVFNPTSSQTVTVRAGGAYNYTTVNIPSGVTVTYVRGADNAPVTILASGDVTVSGAISVSGTNGLGPTSAQLNGAQIGAQGGPGGFKGGNGGFLGGTPPTAGQGPGGGVVSSGAGGSGGSYFAPSSFALVPLFGGSGGGGGTASPASNLHGGSGAGGGGAILIASSTRISLGGQIRANGGNAGGSICNNTTMPGAGSGGAIRLVAPLITGGGNVQALRGTGTCSTAAAQPTDGRIRMEASDMLAFTGTTAPTPTVVNAPGPVSPSGSPALGNVPTLSIDSVGGFAVPPIRGASYFIPDIQLEAGTANPVPVSLSATNTPVGSSTEITVRLMPQSGAVANTVVPATNHTGTFAASSASVGVNFPVGQVSVIQAYATMTLTGQTASLFPLIDGEPVERVTVAARLGEPSTMSLVTRSGREVALERLEPEDRVRVALAWEAMGAMSGQ